MAEEGGLEEGHFWVKTSRVLNHKTSCKSVLLQNMEKHIMTKSDDCEEVNIGALFNYEGMASSKIQVVFFFQFPQPCLSTFFFQYREPHKYKKNGNINLDPFNKFKFIPLAKLCTCLLTSNKTEQEGYCWCSNQNFNKN